MEICGNVERNGPAFFKRGACRLQVYSSREVARGMVVSLQAMGILGEAVRCPVCRRFHVIESR